MKKIILSLGLVGATAAPITATVSCGSVKNNEVSAQKFDVNHNYDFLNSDQWSWYKNWISENQDILPKINFDKESFEIKTLVSQSINDEKHFSELLINKQNNSEVISHISLFPKDAKSDIVTSRAGLTNWSKITTHSGIENYNFVTNIQAGSLNQGGMLDNDLLIKDGVIYNTPNDFLVAPNRRSRLDVNTAIVRNKDNTFSYVANVPVTNDSLIKLHVRTNGKDVIGRETKGLDYFDVVDNEGIDLNHQLAWDGSVDPNGQCYAVDYKGPLGYMKAGDVRVVTEFQKDQKTPMDLTDPSLHAYLVEATELNGITTVANRIFSDVKTIIQAPFKAKVIKELDKTNQPNLNSYIVPTGKALIVVKGDSLKLEINQEVSADYEFDKSNPLAKEFENVQWATTSKDYLGNRGYYKEVEPGDVDVLGAWVQSASWVLRNGKMPYIIDPISSNVNVNYSYFVEMENGDYGIASFTKTKYNPNACEITGNQLIAYLRSLGAKNAVSLDGGGSVQQFIRNGQDQWTPFPASADTGGFRILPSALAIGGRND